MALNTDFAFEGFRIIRERPQLVIYWTLLSLIKFGGGLLILSAIAGPSYMEWQRLMPEMADHANDQVFLNKLQGLLLAIAPAYFLVVICWQFIDGAIYAAVLRAVNKSAPYRFGYFNFNKETWRMGLISLLIYALILIILLGLMFLVLIIVALTSAIPGLMVIASFVGFLGVMFAILWAYVRLSFSWAASFDEGKLAINEGLKLTRGIAWPLFGGYALAVMMTLVVGFLVQIIFNLITLAVKGEELKQLASAFSPDLSSVEALMTPDSLVFVVSMACQWSLIASLMMGATAAAYRQVKGLNEPS
jgi:hypothetical protein